MYGKELFSVYPDGPAETHSAVSGKIGFSGGFSVYPRFADAEHSSVPKERTSSLLRLLSGDLGLTARRPGAAGRHGGPARRV